MAEEAQVDQTRGSLFGEEGEWDDYLLSFNHIFHEEQQCIDRLHSDRELDGKGDRTFSVAFSGGGVRAAAFQAGVLWRLAQANLLKDVEYLAAVSGGGYLASAFATHCLDAEPPARDEVRKWYLDVVAKTICRMQDNAGNFVRDCVAKPGRSEDGSGHCPRICDCLIMLCYLLVTILVNPFFFVVSFIVPFTVIIENVFGARMRMAYCSQGPLLGDTVREGSFKVLFNTFLCFVIVAFVALAAQKALPFCKIPDFKRCETERRPKAPLGYLLLHACRGLSVRLAIMSLLLIALLGVTALVQRVEEFSGPGSRREEYCQKYKLGLNHTECTDMVNGRMWYSSTHLQYESKSMHDVLEFSAVEENTSSFQLMHQAVFLLSGMLIVAVCAAPIIGWGVAKKLILGVGPILMFVGLVIFLQFRVFYPITETEPDNTGIIFNTRIWPRAVVCCLGVTFLLLPFFENIRSLFHLYYQRCLRMSFFARGKDQGFTKLAGRRGMYCPFLLLTATCSDFQPPGDTDTISELSMSPLHVGSEETGYVPQPDCIGIAKSAAISGAALLDAITLTMNDDTMLRFWLDVLNLSWGDYVIFERYVPPWMIRLSEHVSFKWRSQVINFLHRIPSIVLCQAWALSLCIGFYYERPGVGKESCYKAKLIFQISAAALVFVYMLSFFSFAPFINVLTLSPLLRYIHQASGYLYVGHRPPRMLYLTDGGVLDCTAILQLLRRRRKRILLVLAAMDPVDDLGVLRTAIDVAKKDRIGAFYDPADPRRDVDVLMEEFKNDKSRTTLQLGISYCWANHTAYRGPHKASTGHLVVVKNRLPPSCEGQPVRPLLTEDEVHTGPWPARAPEPWDKLKTDELGSVGCCDCSHTAGLNYLGRFPQGGGTGYLFLTPQFANHLMRLAYEISDDAVKKVSSTTPLN